MKTNWQTKKLGEVCEIIKDTPPKYSGTKDYYSTGAISNNDFFSPEKVTYKERPSRANSYPKIGDVGFAKMKFTSKVLLISNDLYGAIFSTGFCFLRPNNLLDNRYLFHFIISDEFQNLKDLYASNGIMGGVKNSDVRNFKIIFPPLSEQRHIVKTLDNVFEKVTKAKENAEKNLQNSKELFNSYLQNVFANSGKDWEKKTLGDVCSLFQGIAINAKTKHALVEKSELPLLRIKDLRNNTVEKYIDSNNYPVNALVNESDILYTRTGNSLGLVFRGRKGVLHNNSFKIVPNSKLDRDYLFIWLQNPIFKSKIFSLASKTAQPDITHSIFKIQEITIPPIKEQKAIVKKLDALSAETKKLEKIYGQKLADLEELKKSVLQQAFTGKL